MPYIDSLEILSETNGGLDIILSLYPEAEKSVGTNKLFARRNEKTASTSLKLSDDGIWLVTDFGADSKTRNGISFYAWDQKKDYKETLEEIAAHFGIGQVIQNLKEATFNVRDANFEEAEKSYHFDLLEEWPDSWLKVLGPKVTAELALRVAKMHPVKSYSYVKDRRFMTWESRSDYPIIVCDYGEFKKIYQPLSPDKGNRFRYVGNRPKDFINNLSTLIRIAVNKSAEEERNYDPTDEEAKLDEFKFEEFFLASGERDALNIASLGYNVIWLNSETAKISSDEFRNIMGYTKKLYNVPDLDSTGQREAHSLALKYLDIHTLYLPSWLSQRIDRRKRPRKDVTDLFEITDPDTISKRWRNLMKDAFPYKFWEINYKTDKTGKVTTTFYISNTYLYNFLEKCGFYRLRKEGEKNPYVFIHIVDNHVKQVEPNDVSDYVSAFLAERKEDIKLRDYVYNSNRVNESSLSKLKFIEPNFKSYGKDYQLLFFKEAIWRITKDGIEELKPDQIDVKAWENKIFNIKIFKDKPYFNITKDKEGNFDIDLHRKDVSFLNFLIQTSRMHWKSELETQLDKLPEKEREEYKAKNKFSINGSLLSKEEAREQKEHLINKLFSIGYLLHRYKDMTKAWLVYAMDNKISEDGQSHGGSGKSIILNSALRQMYGQNDPNSQSSFYLSGRNPKLVDNNHLFDGVTKFTDYIIIDDADQHLKFKFFFSFITADLSVNPKGTKQFNIAFAEAPKMAITSNFPIRNMDPSSARRMLFMVTSDYYHHNKDGEYRESREPKQEFQKQLIRDYDELEMAEFYNLMAQCLQFYLTTVDKVNPPMENVEKRHSLAEMGDDFKNWADLYFDSTYMNQEITKESCYSNWFEMTNKAKWATPNVFKKKLKHWCKYHGYILNPDERLNDVKAGRIVRMIDGKSQEMVYISTSNDVLSSNEELENALNDEPNDFTNDRT